VGTDQRDALNVIALDLRFSVWFRREIVERLLGPVRQGSPGPERRLVRAPGPVLATYSRIEPAPLVPAFCASRPDRGRPLLPLAITRSTKQKRFQSLKQASLTRGVLSVDSADLSEIAMTLLLLIRSPSRSK
jgi:hypothetical protein